jgi:DNA-binding beta-propeller fold protein YncE
MKMMNSHIQINGRFNSLTRNIYLTIIMVVGVLIPQQLISQEKDERILFEKQGYTFPYEVNKPNDSWKLPKILREISGISYINDYEIACIQDEKGNIYIFSFVENEITQKIDFGENGDYEGVQIVNNDIWALKSSGTLLEVPNFRTAKEIKANKYKTELSKGNDTEGLGYDPINNELLIACKGHPFINDKDGKEYKAIYSFNLKTKSLQQRPFMIIELDSIKHQLNYNTMTHMGMELLAYFDESKGDLSFQPSGIAVNPKTQNIYVIASVGNLLIVFSREGDILTIVKLKSKYFPQPEGICFSNDGILYISNEGKDDKGTILKFDPTIKK